LTSVGVKHDIRDYLGLKYQMKMKIEMESDTLNSWFEPPCGSVK